MQKSDIHILVVEDDPTLGKALEEGLKRAGYSARLVASAAHAKSAMKLQAYLGLVVDCLLPNKNGVDFATEALVENPRMVTVLTSGIYKDRVFATDSVLKTKAKAFLNKPFDLAALIEVFDQNFNDLLDDNHEPIYQLLTRDQYSPRDKIIAIENTKYMHGFDLPFVYSLLLDPQIVGFLEIVYDDGRKSHIGFNRGRIDYVLHPDVESYFGVLLVEKGFTSPEEVEEILAQSGSGKLLGQKLIDSSYLSPHAIEIVQHEQMVIRISKTIQDTSVKVSFVTEDRAEPNVFIDGFLFTQLLSDWIVSKITPDWLNGFFRPWFDNPLVSGAHYSHMNFIKDLPAARAMQKFSGAENWPHTIQELIGDNVKSSGGIQRAVFFMLVQRILKFGSKQGYSEDPATKLNRLNRIWAEMQKQNYFENLGVSSHAKPSEINRAYHDLAKTFHPDRLLANATVEVKELTQQIFTRVTEAYHVLSHPERLENYVKTLEVGMAEDILKSESTFEEGIRQLNLRQFNDARKTFKKALSMKGRRSDTIIYYIWALIKDKRHRADRHELADKVAGLLPKVAHEDRHGPKYYMIKGMFYELTGQVQKAYLNFKHAMSLDPFFEDAKREMQFIKQNYSRPTKSVFSDDLSTVVTKFFKKRSG